MPKRERVAGDEDEFQARMNDLALRVSRAIDGVAHEDVATILSGLISFSLLEAYSDQWQRERAFQVLMKFIRKQARLDNA
jgi:hypothetical protein